MSGQEARPPARDQGEPRPSFEEVYDAYFAFVWRSALRLGAPPANIDDVVQEIFLVAHQRLDQFEGRSSVKTWLFGVVANVVRAHRRMLRTKHPHILDASAATSPETIADPADGPHEQVSSREAAAIADQLLESLDEDKRAAFVLAELEQMSAPEIAAAVSVPVNTVYSRLRVAREEFAKAGLRYRARERWRLR
jgi:RNA polymerase sigma-70 factor (ECF subfamily)